MSGPGFSDFLESCGRPVAYFPALAKALGSIKAAVFLAQLMYWAPRAKNPDGWVFKMAEEWETETGLTYEEQLGARKILEGLKLIEAKYIRSEHTVYYRVNRGVLNAFWAEACGKNPDATEHVAKALVAPGKNPDGIWQKPSSVVPETTTIDHPESTSPPIVPQQKRNLKVVKLEYSEAFEALWKALPVKAQTCGKKAAFSSWKTAVKNGAAAEAIVAGLERWKVSRQWAEGYINHATTWLNQERWKVDPEPADANRSLKTGRAKVTPDNFKGVAGEIKL